MVSNQASVTTKRHGSATSQTATIEVNCADLIVEFIAFSAPPGFPLHSYTVTIKNVGNATADLGGVSVQGFYAATEGGFGPDDAASGQSFSPGATLAPGASVEIVVGNSAAPPPDANWLSVTVDFGEVLAQSDETNNICSVAIP